MSSSPGEFPYPLTDIDKHYELTHGASAAQQAGRIIVERVADLDETRFLDPEGSELYPPQRGPGSQDAFDELSAVYEALGPGDHPEYVTLRYLQNKLMGAYALGQAMPDRVFLSYFNTTKNTHYARIGNIALQSRNATPEELAARLAQEQDRQASAAAAAEAERAAERARKAAIERQKLETLDTGKTPLGDFDHAIVTVGNTQFYLVPDRANTILAARLLQALEATRGEYAEGPHLIEAAWAMMTRSERELFITGGTEVKRTKELLRTSKPIITKYALAILRNLTNKMGITRETSGERFLLLQPVDISFTPEPLAEETDLATLTPIFPPGTPIEERTWGATAAEIPSEIMAEASRLLDEDLSSKAPLTQGDALGLLDLITRRDIKRALRAELTARDDRRTLDVVLDALRGKVRNSLGEGFTSAWRSRMIAGNTTTGSVGHIQQISGGLRAAMTKWHIGIRSERNL